MKHFFTQVFCDRCNSDLKAGRTMSMFSTECICMKCKEEEKKDIDYAHAAEVERQEMLKGNYNFKGIRG